MARQSDEVPSAQCSCRENVNKNTGVYKVPYSPMGVGEFLSVFGKNMKFEREGRGHLKSVLNITRKKRIWEAISSILQF